MKWLHGRDNLDTFLQEANSFHSTIRFTAEVSNDKHVFLDTQSRLDEDRIYTDLYTKPMDTHQYLLPTSCHPKHCCKNIPYSLALRLRRICSDSNTFELRAKELTNQLHSRGVGETKGPLNKGMNGHCDDWRHRRFERSPTAEHFHSADHDFLSHASVCCLEHNKEWSDSTRKLGESYWIRRLNTLCPFGINKGD